jgi:DNA-binding CsgD family transcriptional regulator
MIVARTGGTPPSERCGPGQSREWEDAMLVMTPAPLDDRMTLKVHDMDAVVQAIGTDAYARAGFDIFERSLGADHWALFHYLPDDSLICIATQSRMHKAAAAANISKFVGRCHSYDPSMQALRHAHPVPTCFIKMEIGDIGDRQYRQCFEATHVRERLSLYSWSGAHLYQLSIFRAHGFSSPELRRFTALAGLMLKIGMTHELLRAQRPVLPRHLSLDEIERLLLSLQNGLSKRESEVCARAVAGMSIEGTALDLNVKRTSVITYRRRAYEKLAISCQNELTALINNVRA